MGHQRKCPDCLHDINSFKLFEKGDGRCTECKGTGHEMVGEALVNFFSFTDKTDKIDCPVCYGTGQCQTCGGTGYEYY